MIILAAAVMISLSNNGIIGKAQEAVDANDLKSIQQLAALAWSEWYLAEREIPGSTGKTAQQYVKGILIENNVDVNTYIPNVTDDGVFVAVRSTLGDLITGPDDYGKTVDYTVTTDITYYGTKIICDDNNFCEEVPETNTKTVTASEWQVYYHNDTYVYLIAKEPVAVTLLNNGTTVARFTPDELELYEKFRVGNAAKYTLTEASEQTLQNIAQFIKDYAGFANTTKYGTNVVEGAIGGPTIELLAAGWNAKGYTPTFTYTVNEHGYTEGFYELTSKSELYLPEPWNIGAYGYWLVSPCGTSSGNYLLGTYPNCVAEVSSGEAAYVRPVVCLNINAPATLATGDYDFHLIGINE